MKTIFITLLLLIVMLPFSGFSQGNGKSQNMTVTLEQEPYFPAGENALYRYFYDNLKYSDEAKAAELKGIIILGFDVETDSTLSNIGVIQGIGYGIDEQIVLLMKPLKYAPSIQNGFKLKMNMILNIPIRAPKKVEN